MPRERAGRAARRRGRPVPLRQLLASRGRGDEVSRAELALAMLPGSRRPWSRRDLMRAFHAEPRLAGIRADHAANLVTTMQVAAREAVWADSGSDPRATCRPTRARVAALAGYCLSTWKTCRRQLEAWGWIRVVREGRSEEARRMSGAEGLQYDGNDAAVYVLAIPRLPAWPRAKKQPGPPAAPASPVTRPPTCGALSTSTPASPGDNQEQEMTALRADSAPTPADVLALHRYDGLEKLSERAVAAAWRPFAGALWSVADWLHAVGHWPDGRLHDPNAPRVRFPASWLRWRLSLWLSEADGAPLLSVSQQAAADRAADDARRAREAAARVRVPGTGPGPEIDQLRAERGWNRTPGRQP